MDQGAIRLQRLDRSIPNTVGLVGALIQHRFQSDLIASLQFFHPLPNVGAHRLQRYEMRWGSRIVLSMLFSNI
jgi:hypothetical protein